MRNNPRWEIRQSLSRIQFVIERLDVVLLLSWRAKIDDKFSSNSDRNRLSVILFHERERHLDRRCPAAAGIERTILEEGGRAAGAPPRKFSGEHWGKSPVRSHQPALQQSAGCHCINAR